MILSQIVIAEEFAGVVFASFVAAIIFLVLALRSTTGIIRSLTSDLKEAMAREDTLQKLKESLTLEIEKLQLEIRELKATIREIKGNNRDD